MGLSNIIETGRRLYRNRLASRRSGAEASLDSEQKRWLSELRESGIAMIPGFLSAQACAEIRSALDSTISGSPVETLVASGPAPKTGWPTAHGYSIWADQELSDIRVLGAEAIHPLIRRFHEDSRLCAVGKHYLSEDDLHVVFTMANRVVYRDYNKGSGGGWHRDIAYRRGFKAMVYLCDVDTHHGPFQYIPHSDSALYHLFKTNHPDQYQFSHEEILQLVRRDESRLREATASEGTLLLFETNLIHRGKPIGSGNTRYAMTNYHNH
ncbi:MAG: phytanoyl-CoA dioxygenase family protein [Flavobacteriales bacterium]|jgi:hypothetical protein